MVGQAGDAEIQHEIVIDVGGFGDAGAEVDLGVFEVGDGDVHGCLGVAGSRRWHGF